MHASGEPTGEESAAAFWENRYGGPDRVWSGKPNQALVEAVSGIPPGRALDLGCGEGADSIWLAERGWRVTGVDIAPPALARARASAEERGIPQGQISWIAADLAAWHPEGAYDLVSACFLHSPVELPRAEVLRRAAGAVAPGGHLLVVAHAEAPPWAEDYGHVHAPIDPDQERADLALDPGAWDVVVGHIGSRQAVGPDGQEATLRDSVLLVRRRARGHEAGDRA